MAIWYLTTHHFVPSKSTTVKLCPCKIGEQDTITQTTSDLDSTSLPNRTSPAEHQRAQLIRCSLYHLPPVHIIRVVQPNDIVCAVRNPHDVMRRSAAADAHRTEFLGVRPEYCALPLHRSIHEWVAQDRLRRWTIGPHEALGEERALEDYAADRADDVVLAVRRVDWANLCRGVSKEQGLDCLPPRLG